MSVIYQSNAAAPRSRNVIVPSCATAMLMTDGEPCHGFAPGYGSRREIHEMGLEQSTGGSRARGPEDSMSSLQQSEAGTPR